MAELKTYIVTKLLWNPSLNGTALVHEFVSHYYGPAAPMMQQYIDIFANAAAPSAVYPEAGRDGTDVERRFANGECVHVADRPWAQGGQGRVTAVHADGTYEVKLNASDDGKDNDALRHHDRGRDGDKWRQNKGGPAHPDVVSWVYLEKCDTSRTYERVGLQQGLQLRAHGRKWLFSDMVCSMIYDSDTWFCL